MAAPSRSNNYRKGVPVDFQLDPDEFRDIVEAFRKLPRSASDDMRNAARDIAEDVVIPEIRDAISRNAPGFAPKMNKSVRVGRDRIPKVIVGNAGRYTGRYSGGASSAMLRYGTIEGPYRSQATERYSFVREKWQYWPEQVRGRWTKESSDVYTPQAWEQWAKAADQIIDEWNAGRRF